jgi:hypothetical protein
MTIHTHLYATDVHDTARVLQPCSGISFLFYLFLMPVTHFDTSMSYPEETIRYKHLCCTKASTLLAVPGGYGHHLG